MKFSEILFFIENERIVVSSRSSLDYRYGVEVFPPSTGTALMDMDDFAFYEVAMEKREEEQNQQDRMHASGKAGGLDKRCGIWYNGKTVIVAYQMFR